MKKIGSALLWTFVFFSILFAFDQAMVHLSIKRKGPAEIRDIYLDFRKRLFSLAAPSQEITIESVIEKKTEPPPSKPKAAQRFIYVDQNGDIHFADTLKEVPSAYRKDAQPILK